MLSVSVGSAEYSLKFKMATFVKRLQKGVFEIHRKSLQPLLQTHSVVVNNVRGNHMFKHLAKVKEHKEEYEYEVSNDPKEWESVEKLLPLETVPAVSVKEKYPSGWRPPLDEALRHPYYVERSKNHMLPVYLSITEKICRTTKVKNIHGDIWSLHNELKDYIEQQKGKKISSSVNEGNCLIKFRGDFVYYCEQWLLQKGF